MIIKKVIRIIKKVISLIKRKYFPSQHRLMVIKWYVDGGDYELRFNYNLNSESVVLDLGGYQGQWASDLFSRYKCNIFVFEPVGTFAERIRTRFRNNDQIEVFDFGLGGSSRTESIHISAEGSSVFGTSANTEQIEIIDAKVWIAEHKFTKIDLVKINIEGGEYELLDRLIESDIIKQIDNIQVQFHNISQTSRSEMQRIQRELRKTHKPTYQYEFVWENWVREK